MTHSLSARLRRLWLDVHLWIGVGLLVVLAPLGLSGSYLVWHDPIDHALHAERYATSGEAQLPVEAYAAAAKAAFGQRALLSQIRLPQKPGDPVVALGRIAGAPGPGGRPRTLNAWIDPPSARVLGVDEVARGFSMTMHRLHGTLLIPDVGRKVVGWLGWAMFASCATGLWLWWPRHGGFLRGLRWRRGASQLFNLHHMLGFWICLPLAVLSLTGVIISFPQTAERLVGGKPAAPAQRGAQRNALPLADPVTPLPAALAAAQAARPADRVATVNWPQAGERPAWRIEFRGKGPAAPQVLVDDRSGRVRPTGAGAGGPPQRSPFAVWSRKIHDGTDFGLAWRTVIFLGGLAPAVLSVTGLIMWLRRRSRRRALAAA
ncbi:MAG TPA: PepSY-associated TM helix domain-containing protein [Phenylobacterium sp.]|uniref:PepSY-associated TM helix domain-containing protein n=1 Tax=Phenylobacterium sp. TaxID=1871053 RepID=UPI002B460BC4|nr:PepSY-associated TM helix domain-containing protein [Phenylobacterium sp.]HKR87404.1 PepSY-associated TM helix domain-containing protein [Phenylobacterium sp.]